MLRQLRISLILCTILVAYGCKKMEIVPEESNPILPLALGNTWTYADSFFISTTIPTLDTLASEITYTVANQVYVPFYHDNEFVRHYGWEITNSLPDAEPCFVVPMGDSLIITYDVIRWSGIRGGCLVHLNYSFEEIPYRDAATGRLGMGRFVKSMTYPVEAGMAQHIVPCFIERPLCISESGLLPYDINLTFHHEFPPLVLSDSLATVITPAGTFSCLDFSFQRWSEGVGMIAFTMEDSVAIEDPRYSGQTAFLYWKRVLKDYQLN